MAPSTWPVAQVAQHPRLLVARPGEQQHQLQVALGEHPVDRRAACRAKNGSENTRSSGSGTTSATESVRRVTRLRAAGLGV